MVVCISLIKFDTFGLVVILDNSLAKFSSMTPEGPRPDAILAVSSSRALLIFCNSGISLIVSLSCPLGTGCIHCPSLSVVILTFLSPPLVAFQAPFIPGNSPYLNAAG